MRDGATLYVGSSNRFTPFSTIPFVDLLAVRARVPRDRHAPTPRGLRTSLRATESVPFVPWVGSPGTNPAARRALQRARSDCARASRGARRSAPCGSRLFDSEFDGGVEPARRRRVHAAASSGRSTSTANSSASAELHARTLGALPSLKSAERRARLLACARRCPRTTCHIALAPATSVCASSPADLPEHVGCNLVDAVSRSAPSVPSPNSFARATAHYALGPPSTT